jgi:NAD+ synthase (glutamine-hydrolysing)
MSHYNVNGGVPKTLIQHLIRWVVSSHQFDDRVNEVLLSVLDTEISPELVPQGEDEEIQSSEAKIGPYVLQDFSLFQVLRYGFRPSKVAFLAWHAWHDPEHGDWPAGYPEDKRPAFSLKEIRHWLQVFVQRYYSFSQFKRSAVPNGPKVSHGGGLSPRGDWRAPSDMSAKIWLDEIEREVPED